MGVTERLCRWAVELEDGSIPREAVEIAKNVFLDTLGVAVAGSCDPAGSGRKVISLVKRLGGTATTTVIGGGFKSCSVNAAFANATSAHTLDFDDLTLPINHYNTALVPAVLALGEEVKASGRKTIEAYVAGYEVGTRIGRGVPAEIFNLQRGLHHVTTWPSFGIAASACKLLHANVDQTRVAMGIVASSIGGTRRAFGTNVKPLHAGNAARNGLVAAMLAKEGFTAHMDILDRDPVARPTSSLYFSYPVCMVGEGNYDLMAMTDRLGGPLQLVLTPPAVKLYPGNYGSHVFISLVLGLMAREKFTANDVVSIECALPPFTRDLTVFHDPVNADSARYCMEYQVAAAVLDGKVGPAQYAEERIHRADIREMMKRIEVFEVPGAVARGYVEEIPQAKMAVKLKDGRVFSMSGKAPKGAFGLPLSKEELHAKYRECASTLLSDDKVDESLDMIERVEELKNIGELMQLLEG